MDYLDARGLPFLCRRNYYYEFKHLIPWGVFAGMIEGNAAAIVVQKTFGGSPLLVATASATPIGVLLFSYLWGLLCAGRRKLPLTTAFGSGAALCAATVCLTPRTHAGALIFVIQMACAQAFLAGVVTVRSSLWKHNYPPEVRGKVAARLQAVRLLMGICVLSVASLVFDHDPSSYRYVYPIAAASGLVAILILQRVRVRHESSELRALACGGRVERVSIRRSVSPVFLVRGMVGILMMDRRYARYLATQMLLGTSVQLVMPVLVIVVGAAVDRYVVAIYVIEVIPKLLMFSSLRRWGRLFDRVGVNRFRVYTGCCAAAGLLLGLAATYAISDHGGSADGDSWVVRFAVPGALVLFALRGVLHGLHQGGGTLAWNLGHLHYATRENAELYMGVHQTLTGVRGLIAPFLGVILWHYLGWGVWGIAFFLCVAGVIGFHRLAKGDAPDHRPV